MDEKRLKFYEETILPQRAARNMIKRSSLILILTFFASLILLIFFGERIPPTLALYLIPIIIIVLYMTNNWQQWNAAIVNQLRCPHCGQPLAERVNLFLSPSPRCRHCKRIALVSIEQLENFKMEE